MSFPLPLLGRDEGAGAASPGQAPSLPPAPHSHRRLIDSHGRTIRDLRLSITDRCNFRCVYCMEPDSAFAPAAELLSAEELVRVAAACVRLGVTHIRLTGGEPTVAPKLDAIIAAMQALRPLGLRELSLTSNGSLMTRQRLAAWKRAGLDRVTVSIDSVRPERFAAMTRSACGPETVIAAIRDAREAGFERVKANAVVIRGFNDDELPQLAALARELAIEMRFIEFMPLDASRAWEPEKLVAAAEMVERISAVHPLTAIGRDSTSSTAEVYGFADGSPGRIGMIAPVSRPFCGACSRLRVTADGKVRPCLFSLSEFDLRPILRGGGAGSTPGATPGQIDGELEQFLIDATWTKQAGHGIRSAAFQQPARTMSAIGG